VQSRGRRDGESFVRTDEGKRSETTTFVEHDEGEEWTHLAVNPQLLATFVTRRTFPTYCDGSGRGERKGGFRVSAEE